MSDADLVCPSCTSHLIVQQDPDNTEHESIVAECRGCGAIIDAETLIETALKEHYALESYSAAKDGDQPPIGICPECALTTYVQYGEEHGCAWCQTTLGECARCSASLNADNVDADNSNLCDYCGHMMSKDD